MRRVPAAIMRLAGIKKRILLYAIAAVALPILAACGDGGAPVAVTPTPDAQSTPAVVWNEQLPPSTATASPSPAASGATAAPAVYSLTTGRRLASGIRRPPVLAVIGNAPNVRPQTGLMQADIVYEFVLDRGDVTTRLVALYSDEYPPLAGPIQSARIYFFDLQREYGGMMVYAGYPEEEGYPMFNEAAIDIPAAYGNNLKYLFTRDATVNSEQENTLFCRINELARALYGASGPAVQPRFAFEENVSYAGAKRFTQVGLSFSGKDTGKAVFVYNRKENMLYRQERNSKGTLSESRTLTISANSGELVSEPVRVQNLIVQYVQYTPLSEAYYTAELIGSGKCDYFINGLYTPGYWRRDAIDGVTSYYLRDGSALTLEPGTTWIALHSDQRQIKVLYG